MTPLTNPSGALIALIAERSSLLGIHPRPFLCLRDRRLFIFLPVLSYVVGERVVWVGRTEEGLDREAAQSGMAQIIIIRLDCLCCHSRDKGTGDGTYRTVRICRAGDHLSFKMSKQIRPSLSIFGWLMISTCHLCSFGMIMVHVLDLGEEADFGGVHGVFFGKEELELEDASCRCQRCPCWRA